MAAVKLKRALLIDGKYYQPGVQNIPDKDLKHPHFVRYIGLDIVVPAELSEMVKLESATERAERLHKLEIDAQAKKKELLAQVAEDSKAEAPAADEGKKSKKKG